MNPPTTELVEWQRKQRHYQLPAVVDAYEERRFGGGVDSRSCERKWRAICRAVAGLEGISTVADLPCGTGRFTSRILANGWKLLNGDLSLPMLHRADARTGGAAGHVGSIRLDANRIPLRDQAVDLALCIRFLMHVPRESRVEIMRELGRVARYVVLDVRHKYCLMLAWKKLRRAAGLNVKVDEPRLGLREVNAEVSEAGLRILRKVWLGRPFSQKLLLLCERVA